MNDLPESRTPAAQSNGFHYDVTDKAKRAVSIYWGPGPLPVGAEAEGIVTRDTGEKGALLRIGRCYWQGNAGVLRSVPLRGKAGAPSVPAYCTQNGGDCSMCSLVSYGRDCRNNPVKAIE